ncbi:glutathione S-transferase 1-like [Agrilus planipennis]|nr:glutathione S-transferase 1-like [Agrilus planipennis]
MTITLYFADASPPARSSILTIKALGLKNVTFKRVDLMQREQHKPEFLKLNPQHTVPTLVDEDGFTVWDSHAINTYLASKYDEKSSFYPKDLQKRAIIDQRLHFSCGTLFPRIARTFVGLLFHPEAGISQESIDEIKEAYGFLEKFLEKGKYIAGNELTVADFSLATEVVSIVYCPPSPDEFPKITAWIKRMKELPYFDEVNEKALQILQALVNPKPA